VTVGPNDRGGEQHFPVAEFRVRAFSLQMADREGGLDVAMQPGPEFPKKPVVPHIYFPCKKDTKRGKGSFSEIFVGFLFFVIR
jgi:hypothetical protein